MDAESVPTHLHPRVASCDISNGESVLMITRILPMAFDFEKAHATERRNEAEYQERKAAFHTNCICLERAAHENARVERFNAKRQQ